MTKFLFDERFPSRILAVAPVTVSKVGATYTVSIDVGVGALIPVGSVEIWKIKRQLLWQSAFETVEATVPVSTNDPINNAWSNGGYSVYGDGISALIKTATGWTDNQMRDFYNSASILTRGDATGDL